MDEARRTELHSRREALLAESAMRERARGRDEFVAMVPILAALEKAGEDYDSDSYRALRGSLNLWAHDPRRYAMREVAHAELPRVAATRNAVILARLRAHLGEDDLVTIVLRREGMMLALRMPVLVRHLSALFKNARGDWLAFTAPPANWIVATRHVGALRLSEMVTGTLAEEA